jgi:hypothetical protein
MLDAEIGETPVVAAASSQVEGRQRGGVILHSVVNGSKFHFLTIIAK